MNDFSILTRLNVANINAMADKDFNKYLEHQDKLVEEQNEKLKIFGYEDKYYDNHLIHFFDSKFFNDTTIEETIDNAIEMLAIKDGVDLVKFDNGNLGYVAYYNGLLNGFEIIC